MKIVEDIKDANPGDVIVIDDVVKEVPKHQEINFNEPEKPLKAQSNLVGTYKMPATGGNLSVSPTKKQTFGTKAWWVFKGPILVYLILSYVYVYLSGSALSIYLKSSSLMPGALALHTVILFAFIMLCVMTKRRKE